MIKLISQSAAKHFLHLFGSPVCNSESLPQTDFNFCAPDIRASEIRRIFIARVGAMPFVDWSNGAEWSFRLTQTGTAIDAIRTLWVIGDKPAPTAKRAVISGGRKVTVRKDHVIHATIDDVNQTNHEFIMSLGLGKHFRVWYETMGGFMFGGNDGIVTLFNADMVLLRGQGEIMTYQATLDWNNLRTEDKCISPIFNDISGSCGAIEGLAVTDAGYYQVTFEWDLIPGADFYQYQITGSDGYDSGIVTTHLVAIATAPVLTEGTHYTITVRAVCSNGAIGEWSTVEFDTDELACSPVINLGFDDVTPTSITFSWGDDMLTGVYQYQVTGSDGYDSGIIATGDMSVIINDLIPTTHYTITVWNVCAGYPSDPSSIDTDTLDAPAPSLPYDSKLVAGYFGHVSLLTRAGLDITAIQDISGNGNHLPLVSGNAAQYVPAQFGVQAAIRFPPSPSATSPSHGIYRTLASLSAAVSGALWPASKAQIFVVLRWPGAPGIGTILTYGNAFYGLLTDGFEQNLQGPSGAIAERFYTRLKGNVGFVTTWLPTVASSKKVYLSKIDKIASTNEIIIRDNLGASGAPLPGTNNSNNTNGLGNYQLVVGARPEGTYALDADVAAIVIYDGSLSTIEEDAVMSNLVAFFSL
jgi:hypothetical protein